LLKISLLGCSILEVRYKGRIFTEGIIYRNTLRLLKDEDVKVHLYDAYCYYLDVTFDLGERVSEPKEMLSILQNYAKEGEPGAIKIQNLLFHEELVVFSFILAYFGVNISNDCRIIENQKNTAVDSGDFVGKFLMGQLIPGFGLMAKSEARAAKRRKERLHSELSSNSYRNPIKEYFESQGIVRSIDSDELFKGFFK
jgi:hypothetical protein